MTFLAGLEALVEFAKALGRWLLVLAVVVLALLLVRSCRGQENTVAALQREQGARRIEKLGLVLVQEAREAAQRVRVAELERESEDFRVALEKARAALKARPVLVARASTGPVPIRPVAVDGQGSGGGDGSGSESVSGASPPECLLAPGDQGEIVVREVVLETREGNRVLVGAAEALRVYPDPRLRLFGGTFSTPLTDALGEPAPLASNPGWGAGLGGGIASTGPVGSLLVMSPALLGNHLSAFGALSAGSDLAVLQAGLFWR